MHCHCVKINQKCSCNFWKKLFEFCSASLLLKNPHVDNGIFVEEHLLPPIGFHWADCLASIM